MDFKASLGGARVCIYIYATYINGAPISMQDASRKTALLISHIYLIAATCEVQSQEHYHVFAVDSCSCICCQLQQQTSSYKERGNATLKIDEGKCTSSF